MTTQEQIQYDKAVERVHKIKGFYKHLIAFILVNLVIAYFNYEDLKPGESYFKYTNFITFFFWGIGLLAHALGLFLPQWVLGSKWEERKIQEFMEKQKSNSNWE